MLAIKFKLIGKKHQRMFRVIVAEKRSKLQGRFVDDVGFWNPHSNKYSLDKGKVQKWLKNGAHPTDGVFNLLVKAGIVSGPKIPVHKKSEKAQASNTEAAKEKTVQLQGGGVTENLVNGEDVFESSGEKSNMITKEN